MDLPHLHLVRCNQSAFRRLLRAGETFDFSQCFICTLIALVLFLDLLITSCFQQRRPVYQKRIPTKGKERMISQTERTANFSPYPMKCQKQKIHIVLPSGDVERWWHRHLTHHSDVGKMTHERQSKGQEVINSRHQFRIQPFVDQTQKADRIFFLTRSLKRK